MYRDCNFMRMYLVCFFVFRKDDRLFNITVILLLKVYMCTHKSIRTFTKFNMVDPRIPAKFPGRPWLSGSIYIASIFF